MRRATVFAREATVADIPELIDLFDQLRAAGPRRSVSLPVDTSSLREAATNRFVDAVADSDQRLLVAEAADGIAGMVLCTIGSASSLNPAPAVVLSHLTVAANARRAGVGRVLVAAATAWAAECDIDHVRVAVYASAREANRFFARLGFAPVSVNRVAPVAGLRRILGAEVPAAEVDSGDIARRRRLRLGITGGGRTTTARRRTAT
ncbi:MAG: family N-acetyltransferase [Mycobacterium sp.]|nr:family N-acetyltransferase [Mycobacterium sp.]